MSDMPPPSEPCAAAQQVSSTTDTCSVKSDDGSASVKSATSTASIAKPSGIKPPSQIARIGRPCCQGHTKAPLPPEVKQDTNMRRQSATGEDYSRSHLSDVFEESEADLVSDRLPRSPKSKSPDNLSTKPPKIDRKISTGSMNSDLYLEATGRRRSSDQGIVLTSDTDSFIIGQRIWVGGIRPGHIAYIGETHFAPGEWAGIVLDDPNGKNDGCVAGKRYFQCEPKRGIFSRLTRLTREQLGASASDVSMNLSSRSIVSPSRSGTVSPTHSVMSYVGRTPSKSNLMIGDRVIVSSGLGSRPGILQYIGETKFAAGNWCGIQLDEPTGKNDGTVDDVKYFECPQNYGIFVPLAKVTLSPSARKTRLSRAGSKESLTSVGTIGSIASTATSRLRMSAQRSSYANKPITTPKNTFSLQDVLREKQNHIEKLLNERDLDRQDAENQTMIYQKTITQLKEKIITLEKRLDDETRRTEDLQFSIDEATFCRDEVTIQDYKDRIKNLEIQLSETKSSTVSDISSLDSKNAEISAHQEEITKLQSTIKEKEVELVQALAAAQEQFAAELATTAERHKEDETEFKNKLSFLGVTEQCLRDEIDYLKSQNADMKAQLVQKDESTEKEYLNMRHIENELKEEIEILKNDLKEREATVAGKDSELQKIIKQTEELVTEKENALITGQLQGEDMMKQKVTKIAELTACNEELTKNLQKTIEDFNVKMSEMDLHATQLQNELRANLESSQLEHSKAVKLLESEREQLAKYENQIKDLLAASSELEGKLKECESYGSDLALLRKQFEEETKKNVDLEKNFADCNKKLEESEILLSESKSKLNELNLTNENLHENSGKSLQIKDDTIVELNERLTKASDMLREKQTQIEAIQANLSDKKAAHKAEQEKCAQLNEKLAELSEKQLTDLAKLSQLEETTTKYKEQERQSLSKIEQLNEADAALHKQIDNLNIENSKTISELSAQLEASQVAHAEELKVAHQSLQNLQNDFKLKSNDFEKVEKTNGELVEKLQLVSAEATALQGKLSKLEVEHGDLGRKMIVLEQRCEQITQEKSSLQQNLEVLQNSSSDTNSEIVRLTEQIQTIQKSHEDVMARSNETQLSLERRLHETVQNLEARTRQFEQAKDEIDGLSKQKIDSENELNLELVKEKEISLAEKNSLAAEIETLKRKAIEEKEQFGREVDVKLAESSALRDQLNEAMRKLEETVSKLQQDVENGKNEMNAKEIEFTVQLSGLRDVEANLRRELAERQTNELNLTKNLDEMIKSSSEGSEQLLMQLNEKTSTLQNAEQELAELRRKCEQSDSEYQLLGDEFAALQKTRDNQKAKIEEDTQRFVSEKEHFENQIKEMDRKFKQTEDEQVDLVNRNEELLAEILTNNKQIATLTATNADLNEQISSIKTNFETFKADTATISTAMDEDYRNLFEKLQAKIKVEAELNQALHERDVSHDEFISKLTEASDESVQQMELKRIQVETELKQEISDMSTNLKGKDETITALEDKIDQLTKSVNLSDNLMNAEISQKSEELKLKELKISELNELVDKLKHQLNDQTDNLNSLRAQKEADNQQSLGLTEEKNRENESLQAKIKELENVISTSGEKFGKISKEKEEVEIKNLTLVADVTSLNESIQELNQKFNKSEEERQKQLAEFEEKLAKSLHVTEQQTAKLKQHELQEKDLVYAKTTLERREHQLVLESKQLADKLLEMKASSLSAKQSQPNIDTISGSSDDETGAQISFLNSIIADMQKKNETLSLRIRTLEAGPADFVNNGLFDIPVKRLPAPRLFCDICDEFDGHDTEDCPLQSSDSPPPPQIHPLPSSDSPHDVNSKERKLPPPRKYCESCEAFGHATEECANDETY